MTYKFMDRIHLPILFIRGEHDHLVEDWEAEEASKIEDKTEPEA